jgi:hypothetical protein
VVAGGTAFVSTEATGGVSTGGFFPYQSTSAISTAAMTTNPKIEPRIFMVI